MTMTIRDAIFEMPVYQWMNLLAAGLVLFHWVKHKKGNLFTAFLIFVVCTEIIVAKYFEHLLQNNHIVYNVVIHGSMLFYYAILRAKKTNIFIDFVFGLWVIWQIYTVLFGLGWMTFRFDSYLIGLVIVLFVIIGLFYEKVFAEKFEPIAYDYRIWLAAGVALFIMCSFPLLVSFNEIVEKQSAYHVLLDLGNVMQSLGYLIAAYCMLRNYSRETSTASGLSHSSIK